MKIGRPILTVGRTALCAGIPNSRKWRKELSNSEHSPPSIYWVCMSWSQLLQAPDAWTSPPRETEHWTVSQRLALLPSIALTRVSHPSNRKARKAIASTALSLFTSTKLRTMLLKSRRREKETSQMPQLRRTKEVLSHATGVEQANFPILISKPSWGIKTADQRDNGISKFHPILPSSCLTPIWPSLFFFPVVGKDLYTDTKHRGKNADQQTHLDPLASFHVCCCLILPAYNTLFSVDLYL